MIGKRWWGWQGEERNEQEVRENFHFYSTARLWGLLRIVYVMGSYK